MLCSKDMIIPFHFKFYTIKLPLHEWHVYRILRIIKWAFLNECKFSLPSCHELI